MRAGRATLLTALVITLAAAAHASAGGALIGPIPFVTLMAMLAPLGWYAVRTRLSARHLVVLLGAGQLLVHGLITAMQPTGGGGAARPMAHHPVLVDGSSALPTASASSWAMWLAHIAATLATAWVLARGEAALWRVIARLVPTLSRPLVRLTPFLRIAARPRTGVSRTLRRPLGARGPPLAMR